MARQRHGLSAVLATLLAAMLYSTAHAQSKDGDNKITYPNSSKMIVNYLDTIVISYETDYTTPWMYLFCERNSLLQEIVYYSPSDIAGHSTFSFELKFDYMTSTPCWFNLRPSKRDSSDNSTDVGASSPTFEYVAEKGDRKTFALDPDSIPTTTKETATKTSSTPTNTPGGSDSESSNSDPNSDSNSGGLSTGAKAGIAIGVLAMVGLAAATAWLLFDRRRRQKTVTAPGSPSASELENRHDYSGFGGAVSAVTNGRGSMTMPVSPPSENNTIFSPLSAMNHTGSAIHGGLPPPPPPAAEKPRSMYPQQQLAELPSEPQRYELDGVGSTPYLGEGTLGSSAYSGESPITHSPLSLQSPIYKQ